jgi:hypothetical protein
MSENENPSALDDGTRERKVNHEPDDTFGHRLSPVIDDQDGADGQPGYSGALNPDIDLPS